MSFGYLVFTWSRIPADLRGDRLCPDSEVFILNTAMASNHSIRRLTTLTDAGRSELIGMFEAALANDHAVRSVTGGSKDAERAWYTVLIDTSFEAGQVWIAEDQDKIIGASLWYGPGTDVNATLSDRYYDILPEEMREWVTLHFRPKYEELYTSTYPSGDLVRVDAWHLKLLAVHPRHQRRGLGTALISPMLNEADRSSKAVTTDVPTSSTLNFLQRRGLRYTGVKNFLTQASGFPIWCMIRDPAPPSVFP